MNEKKINILCSTVDRAGLNIKEHLLLSGKWKTIEELPESWDELVCVHENREYRIIEIDQHHIYQDRIDEKMKRFGFDTDLIIVASKHKSNDGRSVLTAHFTGNVKSADFGGHPFELSVPAPHTMRSILKNMQKLADSTGYEVNMESTHHGPTDIRTPMVYAEIGSGEEQWSDPEAGRIVAEAILNSKEEKTPIAIGFGGGHYASRQTSILLEENITFGHNFPDYQLADIDKDFVKQAFEKSRADFAYFDRKSMQSSEKERMQEIIRELGHPLLREGDIKELKGLDWDRFLKIRKMAEELCPGSRLRISDTLRSKSSSIKDSVQESNNIIEIELSEKLLQETVVTDRETFLDTLEGFPIVYLERENGTISNHMLCLAEHIKITMQDITNECIKILKEHYEVKYVPQENLLYIVTERFSPKMAKEMGVNPGPLYGKLANRETVTVNGKTIGPELVHVRKIKEIPLINPLNNPTRS
ncbi:MAG: D-aminoacyl-tRNA deacylase [Methanolobus sp.]|nr:D-aminoacyl-tRNA deacylase [Methanolobus sp.]